MTLLDLLEVIKNKINSFEHFIEKEIIENKGDVDEWFDNLVNGGIINPSINKDPIEDNDTDYVDDRFDLGLHKVAVALINGEISRRIDANKPVDDLEKIKGIFKYFVTDEVPIDCNKNDIRVDCIIDPNELYLTRKEIGSLYNNEIIEGIFEVDAENNVKDTDPIYDYIYPENEIVLDANVDYETVIVLDANNYI